MRLAAARPIIAFLCTAFVALGLSIASIGPALPEFAAVAAIDVSSIGVLYSALFAGFLLSQITATLLLERTGTRVVILWALAVFADGTLGLAVAVQRRHAALRERRARHRLRLRHDRRSTWSHRACSCTGPPSS